MNTFLKSFCAIACVLSFAFPAYSCDGGCKKHCAKESCSLYQNKDDHKSKKCGCNAEKKDPAN